MNTPTILITFLVTLSTWAPLHPIVIANHSHIPSKKLHASIYEVNYDGTKRTAIARNIRFNQNHCLIYPLDTSKRSPRNLRVIVFSPDVDGDKVKEVFESFDMSHTEGVVLNTNHQAKPFPKLKLRRGFRSEMCPSTDQRTEMRYGKRW